MGPIFTFRKMAYGIMATVAIGWHWMATTCTALSIRPHTIQHRGRLSTYPQSNPFIVPTSTPWRKMNHHYHHSERTNSESSITTTNHQNQRLVMSKGLTVNRGLFGFYLILGSSILPLLFKTDNNLLMVVISTVWLGFVLAISGMEAWLKFWAPFCPRPFALDIGRTIFPALNAVESGLAVSIGYHLLHARRILQKQAYLSIGMAASILGVEILFLTPKLVRRGKQVVYHHVKEHGGSKCGGTESAEFQALQAELQGIPMAKTDKWHIVYVGLELIKMISLTMWIRQLALGL